MFTQYRFRLGDETVTRQLMPADWVRKLKLTEHGQVYSDIIAERVFYSPTVGYISALINYIVILEHTNVSFGIFLRRKGKRRSFLSHTGR